MDILGERDRLLDIGPARAAARIEDDLYTKVWLKCSPLVLERVKNEHVISVTLGQYRILEPNQMKQCLELGMRYCLNLLVEGGKKAFYGFLKTLQDTDNKELFDLLRDIVIEAECAEAVGADKGKDEEEKEQAAGEDASLQASMVYGQIIMESATEITRYLQNLQALLLHLKKYNVLSRVAMKDVTELGTNHLVKIMSTRGKTEFTVFLDALNKTENERLHEILKNKMEDAEAIMEKEGKDIPEARPIGKTKPSFDDILRQQLELRGLKKELSPAWKPLVPEVALHDLPRLEPPERPIEILPTRKPQTLLSRDLDTDLDIGSLAEVNIKRKEKGVVRWLGFYDSPLKPIVGIELDFPTDDATDGTYKGTRVFKCEQNKALFVPLQNCRPDPRFSAEIEEDIVGRVQDIHRSKPRTEAPSADVSAEFIAGARVTVNFGGSLHGIVRWTGRGGSSDLPMVGVELDAENQAASDGVFEGKKLFICPPKKALFVPAAVCKIGELTIEDPGLDKGVAFRQISQTATNLGTIGITPDIQRLIPEIGHKDPVVEVTELDPAYLRSGFSYGALVKVDIGADILGKFRWYGRCSAISHPLGGVELMNPHPDGTDGSFLGHRLFSSDRERTVVVCLCKLQVVPSSTPQVSRTPAIQAPTATTPSSGQGRPSLMDSFSTHRSLFIQELRVQDLLHKLQTVGVLDTHQVEQVEERTDRRDQASYIMDIMAEAEMRSKGKFFNVLKTHQKELFQQLIGMAAMR